MERKLATVLFADLVGSTEFVSAQDPEITRRRVTAFFDGVSNCIETHGGTVEKFAGDAVMAAFGIPQAHEDDAERAVRAALGIIDNVRELGVEARIGIEAGEVVVDETDSTFATGEAVNVAARLQQAAGPGEILIGSAAHRLTDGSIETENVGPLELRGFRLRSGAPRLCAATNGQPKRVAVVGAVRRARVGARAARQHPDADDSRQASTCLHRLRRAGRGEEPAASGVPRRREGVTILAGRALPYGEGVTYWPLAEMVKAAAGITDDDPMETAKRS